MAKTGPQKYPGASTSYWYQSAYPGSAMESNVCVIHTTEGTSLPSYDGGAIAPNLTAVPDIGGKRLRWYQHFDFDVSSRALANASGGVETNTLNCVQIELVGTCDPTHRSSWGSKRAGQDYVFWPDAPDWALAELAKFVRWAHDNHGVKRSCTVTFKPYPASYGDNGVRLTGSQWQNYYGWLGHQHVPENCVHPDTPILCADLTWRRAGDVGVGTEIVSFDEETDAFGGAGGPGGGRRYRKGVVTRNDRAVKDSYRVVTSQGEVIATADHPWLVRMPGVSHGDRSGGDDRGDGRIAWVASRDLDPGRHRIISLGRPWSFENSRTAGWLAGVLDTCGRAVAGEREGGADGDSEDGRDGGDGGDGGPSGACEIGFARVDAAVLGLFAAECDRRGWPTKTLRRDETSRDSGQPDGAFLTDVRVLGGMWESCRVLGTLRPERLLPAAGRMWQGSDVDSTTGDVAVIRVEHVGKQPIASLSTDTHTYVADGLLCHNTHGDPGALDFARVLEHAKNPGTPPDEEDDMPKYTHLGTDWQTVQPDSWTALKWDSEWVDQPSDHVEGGRVALHGPAQFTGSVGIRAEGLPKGAQLQIAINEVDVDSGEEIRDLAALAESVGTVGDTFSVVPLDGRLAKGRGLRVRVFHQQEEALRLKAYLRLHSWAG